ncbi:ribonuclease E activity regulator RraA [Domibacillus epiphyticus]|uniref:4-hydroxy-4-methyl-2-oxoglutarate aldolase n=1 Tax=Domibacillus epiphyticus TaxID=1714355 RepID=A0A1V2AAV3_9BACI|nr:ribonuclease E activity regulator RraA [Domibacillus epiphyticus]OMP68080.1 S-adenosylmethionine--2-demethylmenaquinone methyltransferase [Domibacillus epiphyticus]
MVKTADLCDDYADELTLCRMELKSFGGKKQFEGPISTVKVFEDNVLVKESLKTIPEGHVLVVDGGGSKNCALVGDLLGAIAEERKIAGIIVNGCVRDTAELATQNIGVLALGSNPFKSIKKGEGERDIPVNFGDAAFVPGHYVYADEDGVVVAEQKL